MFTNPVVAARTHVFEKMIERYGVDVSQNELVRIIERGDAKLKAYGAIGTGRLIYAVPVGDSTMNCVYAPPLPHSRHGVIVTVLPPELKWEKKKAEDRARRERTGAAKRELYRGFRRNSEDDENGF